MAAYFITEFEGSQSSEGSFVPGTLRTLELWNLGTL